MQGQYRVARMLIEFRLLVGAEDGQDTTEYGIMLAFIAPIVIAVIVLFGPELSRYFQDLVDALALGN